MTTTAYNRLSDWACASLLGRLEGATFAKRREVFQKLARAFCIHCGRARTAGRVCVCRGRR